MSTPLIEQPSSSASPSKLATEIGGGKRVELVELDLNTTSSSIDPSSSATSQPTVWSPKSQSTLTTPLLPPLTPPPTMAAASSSSFKTAGKDVDLWAASSSTSPTASPAFSFGSPQTPSTTFKFSPSPSFSSSSTLLQPVTIAPGGERGALLSPTLDWEMMLKEQLLEIEEQLLPPAAPGVRVMGPRDYKYKQPASRPRKSPTGHHHHPPSRRFTGNTNSSSGGSSTSTADTAAGGQTIPLSPEEMEAARTWGVTPSSTPAAAQRGQGGKLGSRPPIQPIPLVFPSPTTLSYQEGGPAEASSTAEGGEGGSSNKRWSFATTSRTRMVNEDEVEEGGRGAEGQGNEAGTNGMDRWPVGELEADLMAALNSEQREMLRRALDDELLLAGQGNGGEGGGGRYEGQAGSYRGGDAVVSDDDEEEDEVEEEEAKSAHWLPPDQDLTDLSVPGYFPTSSSDDEEGGGGVAGGGGGGGGEDGLVGLLEGLTVRQREEGEGRAGTTAMEEGLTVEGGGEGAGRGQGSFAEAIDSFFASSMPSTSTMTTTIVEDVGGGGEGKEGRR